MFVINHDGVPVLSVQITSCIELACRVALLAGLRWSACLADVLQFAMIGARGELRGSFSCYDWENY